MKFVVRFSYPRVAKGRVFSATEYSTCHTFTNLRTTDFAATNRKLLNVYVFAAPKGEVCGVQRNGTPLSSGQWRDTQAMGEVAAVKKIMKNGIGTWHEP